MAKPSPRSRLYGLVAQFDRPEALLTAAERTRAEGFRDIEAFSPFPVDGLAEAVGFRERRLAPVTLAGGVLGAAVGYGLQVYTNLDFPLNIGGRPLMSPPAFALITFELMVLFAVLTCIGAMLLLNRLPRLHHPLFEVDDFHFTTSDRFFLAILSCDPKFDARATRRFLRSLRPISIEVAALTEPPE
jgi:hypothetical protein